MSKPNWDRTRADQRRLKYGAESSAGKYFNPQPHWRPPNRDATSKKILRELADQAIAAWRARGDGR